MDPSRALWEDTRLLLEMRKPMSCRETRCCTFTSLGAVARFYLYPLRRTSIDGGKTNSQESRVRVNMYLLKAISSISHS
jgi:hypothetical protein